MQSLRLAPSAHFSQSNSLLLMMIMGQLNRVWCSFEIMVNPDSLIFQGLDAADDFHDFAGDLTLAGAVVCH